MKWFFACLSTVGLVAMTVFCVGCVYGILFPLKYQDEIAAASATYGVEQAVIFSCINVESHFDESALSSKGAVGLMQILPSTAKAIASAEQEGEEINLYDPQQNINLGTKYLAQLVARFENLETALAAYNAGPTTVATWLKNSNYSIDGKTLSSIPYEETRNYIKKFNRNLKYYQSKLN